MAHEVRYQSSRKSRCLRCWGTGLCPLCMGSGYVGTHEKGSKDRPHCPECWDPRRHQSEGLCRRCRGLGEELEMA